MGSSQTSDETGRESTIAMCGLETLSVSTARSRSQSVASSTYTTDICIEDYTDIGHVDSLEMHTTAATSSSSSLVGTSRTLDNDLRDAPHLERLQLKRKLPTCKRLLAHSDSKQLQISDSRRTDLEIFEPVDNVFTVPPVAGQDSEREVRGESRKLAERPRTMFTSSCRLVLKSPPGSEFMSLPRHSGAAQRHDGHFLIQDQVALSVVLPAVISQGATGLGRTLKASFSPYTRAGDVTKIVLEVSIPSDVYYIQKLNTSHLTE